MADFPWYCDFENSGGLPDMCGFVQDAANSFDWKVKSGPLQSSIKTGPAGASLDEHGEMSDHFL